MRRILLLIAVLLMLSACDDVGRYKGQYPELQSIATHSILGLFGHESDEIYKISEDEWGRVLFAYVGGSITSDNPVIAILVSQKTTKSDSFFYDTFNFIVKECPDYDGDQKLSLDLIERYFSEDEIEQLKITNDWGLPMLDNLLFEIKITRKKVDTVSDSKQRSAFELVTDKFRNNSSVLLSTDRNGLSLYFMSEITVNKESRVFIYGKSYLAMFDKSGNVVSKSTIEILNDRWMYQEQLRSFKAKNGWAFHD